MKTAELETICQQIEEFSLLKGEADLDTIDLKDILLQLASTLRKKDLPYYIEYNRPDQPVFRLRSPSAQEEDVRSKRISLLEPGHEILLKISDMGEGSFEGISSELRMLGEASWKDEEAAREPELNLLNRRPFRAELFAEFQRWERYSSPFIVALIHCPPDDDSWKRGARELKHLGKSWDVFGFLDPTRLTAIFRSRSEDAPILEELNERLKLRFPEDNVDVEFLCVPADENNWHSLQEWVFQPETSKESDLLGNKAT